MKFLSDSRLLLFLLLGLELWTVTIVKGMCATYLLSLDCLPVGTAPVSLCSLSGSATEADITEVISIIALNLRRVVHTEAKPSFDRTSGSLSSLSEPEGPPGVPC